ncbi:hypothetical protein FE783_21360 [Paenibacillus mesophilus]|nr:hypothetical protein FE783_21360 [Paenibacillus mesophilus]
MKIMLKWVLVCLVWIVAFPAVAQAEPTVLPADADKVLPFYNDAREPVKLRGSESFDLKIFQGAPLPWNMVRDAEGTIYFTNTEGISAVNRYGHLKWSYKIPSPPGVKYVTLGQDGTIFVFEGKGSYRGTDSHGIVFAFRPDGTVNWVYHFTDRSTLFLSQYAGDANGNFIVETDQGLISIGKNGVINWSNKDILKLSPFGTDNLLRSNVSRIQADKQGNVFVTTTDDGLWCLDSRGKVRWKLSNETGGSVYVADEHLFLFGQKGLQAYDKNGLKQVASSIVIPQNIGIPTDFKGSYYVKGPDGIMKIDGNGNEIWSYAIREPGYRDGGNITTDSFGNVYFSNNGGSVYSLDENGNERFVLYIQHRSSNSSDLLTDSAGTVYVLSKAFGLAAISPKDKPIRIWKDNNELFFTKKPTVYNGSTMLPMRELFESLGAIVKWDSETRTITALKDGMSISLTVDSYTASINGKPVQLEAPPVIVDESTWVPLRFVGEALGATVVWDEKYREIQLLAQAPNEPSSNPPKPIKQVLLADVETGFYTVAPEGWKVGSSASDKNLFSTGKDQHFQVDVVMKSDLNDKLTLSGYTEMIADRVEGNIEQAIVSPIYDFKTKGLLKAKQFGVRGEAGGYNVQFLITVYESLDSYYMLYAWTVLSKYPEIHQEFSDIAEQFRVMDTAPRVSKS